jgi:hypothetical protein
MEPFNTLPPDPALWQKGYVFVADDSRGQTQQYLLDRTLGGGLTSVVWLVKWNDTELALKVLRPSDDPKFLSAFETEIQVLNRIHNFYETRNLPGNWPVPRIYHYSPKDAQPAYIAMELVRGREVAALVGRKNKLPAQIKEIRIAAEDFYNRLDEFRSSAFAETDLPPGVKDKATDLVDRINQIREKLPTLISEIDTWAYQQKGLSEQEILIIGVQTAQVFQVLHEEAHRSYKDFQLKNFYLDRPSGTRESYVFKILDWNVVSDEYDTQIAGDLFNLASSLYYLITLLTLEKGATPVELERWGGTAWNNEISYALRLVLRRALSLHESDRYQQAYNWGEQTSSLKPISDCQTFGEALEMVAQYSRADSAELVDLANNCADRQLSRDAQAACEWARRNLEQVSQDQRFLIEKNIREIEARIDDRSLPANELLQKCLWWLDAGDIEQARRVVQKALDQAPENLSVHRWNALIQTASLLTHEQFARFWKEEKASEVLQTMQQKNWGRAGLVLKRLSTPVEQLVQDVKLNQLLEKGEQYFRHITNTNDMGATLSESFKEIVDDIKTCTDKHQPEYAGLIIKEWPQYTSWQEEAQQVRSRQDNLKKVLESLKECNPFGAAELLGIGIKSAPAGLSQLKMQSLLRFAQDWEKVETAIANGWKITKDEWKAIIANSEWKVIIANNVDIFQVILDNFTKTCSEWVTRVAIPKGYFKKEMEENEPDQEADIVAHWVSPNR